MSAPRLVLAIVGVILGCFAAATWLTSEPPAAPTTSTPACYCEPPLALESAYDDCVYGNLSMSVALDALAAREDGCAIFRELTVTDGWTAYRLRHPARRP